MAFSGEVNDAESGPDGFTENSAALNPNLRGRDIREAFKGDEYQILLVANKFQTGFDQPLLCGMYVDKRLAGIQAVQTLSRLNRAHPGKDTTYVLDFANDANEVLEAFKTYYATAELASTTDPNLVFNLRAKLDAAGHYDDFEVDRVVRVELDPKAKQSDLVAALEPVVDRLLKRYEAYTGGTAGRVARGRTTPAARPPRTSSTRWCCSRRTWARSSGSTPSCRRSSTTGTPPSRSAPSSSGASCRCWSSAASARDRPVEGRADAPRPEATTADADDSRLARTRRCCSQSRKPGAAGAREPDGYMNEIIEKLNDLFHGELTDQDKLVYVNNVLKGKLLESSTLRQQAANNSKEQFAKSPDLNTELLNAIIGALDAHTAMSTQALNSPDVQRGLKEDPH